VSDPSLLPHLGWWRLQFEKGGIPSEKMSSAPITQGLPIIPGDENQNYSSSKLGLWL